MLYWRLMSFSTAEIVEKVHQFFMCTCSNPQYVMIAVCLCRKIHSGFRRIVT
jgi:hypothetical protein